MIRSSTRCYVEESCWKPPLVYRYTSYYSCRYCRSLQTFMDTFEFSSSRTTRDDLSDLALIADLSGES